VCLSTSSLQLLLLYVILVVYMLTWKDLKLTVHLQYYPNDAESSGASSTHAKRWAMK